MYSFKTIALATLLSVCGCTSNSPQDGLEPITIDAISSISKNCGAGKVNYCERRFGPHKRCGCIDKSTLDTTTSTPIVPGLN